MAQTRLEFVDSLAKGDAMQPMKMDKMGGAPAMVGANTKAGLGDSTMKNKRGAGSGKSTVK